MKVGDTLICKKDLKLYNDRRIYFSKNDIYTLRSINIDDSSVYILYKGSDSGFWFYYIEQIDRLMLSDYFYTKEELRQLKLTSL